MLPDDQSITVEPDTLATGTEPPARVTSPATAPAKEYELPFMSPAAPIGSGFMSTPPAASEENTETLAPGMRTPRPGYLTPNTFSFSRENLSIHDKAETVVSFVIRNPNLVGDGAVSVEECEQNG